MARLIWSPHAIKDLDAICDYLARDSARYACMFAKQVRDLVLLIPEQPRLGSIVPEYELEDIRERLLHNYRIVYRLRGEDIEVVRICQGSRLLPRKSPD